MNKKINYFAFPGMVYIQPLTNIPFVEVKEPIIVGQLVMQENGMAVIATSVAHVEVLTQTGAKMMLPVRRIKEFKLVKQSQSLINNHN